MNYKKVLFFLFTTTIINSQIRIILTAAISGHMYELRKKQYIESFEWLKKFGYENVYVVEALCKEGPTFLDDYCKNVFYSNANNSSNPAGMNEQKTLYDGLNHFGFDDEDMIIKLTGRHQFISDYLIKMVELNPHIDVFMKRAPRKDFAIETIAFAMRCKHLKRMSESIDYLVMITPPYLDLERVVGVWLTAELANNSIIFKRVHNLGVRANTYGSLTALGIAECIIYK